jgi:E3 ubiquitin-protein ligase TRIP12
MHAVATGLYEVVTYGSLSFLSVEELGNLLRGERTIDLADLRLSTTYAPNGEETGQTLYVGWLWQILGELTVSQIHDFIRFVSGSPLAPIHGFTGISKDKKWLSVSLEDGLIVDQVPLAQTCFTQLRIPRYSSINIMRARIIMAIENAKTLENH